MTVTVHIMVPPAAYIPTYTLIIHVGLRHSGSDLDTVLSSYPFFFFLGLSHCSGASRHELPEIRLHPSYECATYARFPL